MSNPPEKSLDTRVLRLEHEMEELLAVIQKLESASVNPSRRKQRTHFLGGEIGLGLGRLDPPAKKTRDLGGKGARDLLFRRHGNNKLGHGRDFHYLDLVRKRQTHVVTFHFLFKKAGGPQLINFILQSRSALGGN